MRNQSNLFSDSEIAPIHVPEDFPVAEPDFNVRGEKPPVRAHIHNLCEIGFCFDGAGVFLVGSKIMTFKAGDAVIINNHEFHLAKGNPGLSTSWGFLNLDFAGLFGNSTEGLRIGNFIEQCCGENFCNIFDGEEHPELTDCIRLIIMERKNMKTNWKNMIRSLVSRLFILLERICPAPDKTIPGKYSDMARIVPALDFINTRFDHPISLQQMAKLCRTSIPNFRKIFQRAMNCSPQKYVCRIRLQSVCSMLKNSDFSIGEIAMNCGYNTISNLNRQFLKTYHISPSEFRKKGTDTLS